VWLVLLLVAGATGGAGCSHTPRQPIAFNHRLHVYNNVPCTVCHATAETGQGASLPAVGVCRRCHEDVLYESPEKAKIRIAAESGQGLAWQPVFSLRPYVYFSHRRHVALGGLACRECHGDVDARVEPFEPGTRPFGGRAGMTACITCHEGSHSPYAGTDCVDCHR
jgi:hypothetical protein